VRRKLVGYDVEPAIVREAIEMQINKVDNA
jgi:hypothetical protein